MAFNGNMVNKRDKIGTRKKGSKKWVKLILGREMVMPLEKGFYSFYPKKGFK